MAYGDRIAVAEPVFTNASAVDEAAIGAVQINDHPAIVGLHEQVLEPAEISAIETDIANRVSTENHAGTIQRDLGEQLPAARDDQVCGVDV